MRIPRSFEFCFMLALAMYLIVPAFAVQVGIGVEPTVVDVYMDTNNQKTYLPVKLFNPSDQSMIFRMEAENALKPYLYLSCDPYENVSYWCESREYILAANTPKVNATISKILFVRNAGLDADFESAIYVIGRSAVSINGTVGITPRVMIRITMHQTTVTTTTTVPTTTTTMPTTTTTIVPVTTTTLQQTTTTMKSSNDPVTTTTKPKVVILVPDNPTTTTVPVTTTTVTTVQEEAVQASVIPVIPEIPIFTYIIILAVLVVLGGAIYIARDRFIIVLILFSLGMSFMMPVALAFDPDAIITVNVTDAVTTTTTSTTTTTTTSTTTTTTTVPTTTTTLVPTTTTTTLPFPEPLFDMSKNLIVLVGAVSMIFAVASLVIR